MKYYLVGHDRNTAVQDTLISLMPEEQHIRVFDDLEDDTMTVEVKRNGRFITTYCTLKRGGNIYTSKKRTTAKTTSDDDIRWDLTRSVKTAVYKCVLQILPHKPVWGSQTGVKPAKIIRFDLQNGMSDEQADEILKKQYFISKEKRDLCISCAKVSNMCEAQLAPNEIQIYIGIAFCPAKCSYCSFVSNSVQKMGHLVEPYVQCLLKEIEAVSDMVKANDLKIGSIYIGGGTPTVLNDEQFERLLTAVNDHLYRDDLREYSVEAGRPETINRKKLELMRDFNVSRISINPQTMMNDVLRGVGRNHTKDDIIEKFNLAREVGNFVINMDLIAGLPGDDEAGLLESVREVCKLDPDNVTVHSLAKKRGAAVIYDNHYDLEAKTLNKAHKYIRSKGYEPYYIYRQKYIAGGLENTGFAKNGTISFYNVAMMEELCTVIAIGAGGVSKITNNFGMKLDRIANPKYPKEYIDNIESIVKTKRELVFNANSEI